MPHTQQPQPAEFKTDTVEHLHQQISILTRLANDLGLEVTWMRLEGVEDCLRRDLAVLRLALDERR